LIPSSLAGLLLFVVLLAPGLAYVLRHERVVPARSHTPFRETLRVVFVSTACLLVAGLLSAAVRAAIPHYTPDVNRLVQDPRGYWRGHHVQLAWWGIAFILVATLIGAVFADRRVVKLSRRLARTPGIRWLTGSRDTDIDSASSWYRVMLLYEEAGNPGPIHVGAAMDDGTYVEGFAWRFSVDAGEDENRDIVLSAPLQLTTLDGNVHPYAAQFAVMSARHIRRLDITHLKPEPSAESQAPEPPSPAPATAPPPTPVA
jgi:hypothetical protein